MDTDILLKSIGEDYYWVFWFLGTVGVSLAYMLIIGLALMFSTIDEEMWERH